MSTVTEAAEAASKSAVSIKDQLVAARKAAAENQTEDFPIPGYGGRLWGTFRPLHDYSEVRAIISANAGVPDDETREIYNGADTLLAASVDTYALIDGEKYPLGMKLGLQLAAHLELSGAETDRQALIGGEGVGIFPGTMPVMALFTEYDQWLKEFDRKVGVKLEGNSGAPS